MQEGARVKADTFRNVTLLAAICLQAYLDYQMLKSFLDPLLWAMMASERSKVMLDENRKLVSVVVLGNRFIVRISVKWQDSNESQHSRVKRRCS